MLAEIWLWLLAAVLAAVVVLDGFDLGVGILCLLEKDEGRREALMASLEGVWHANQTWLVIAGGVLFGAFPRAYGMLLSSLYLPAGLMLLGLMARGIGLEYYAHAPEKARRAWSSMFGLGSLAVALVQGAMLGAVARGLPMAGPQEFPNPLAWLTPGALFGGPALACTMGLMGTGWASLHARGASLRGPAAWFAAGSLVFQAALAAFAPVSGIFPLAPGAVAAACLAWAVTAARSGARYFLPAGLYTVFTLAAWLSALRPGFAEPGLTPLSASASAESLRILLIGSGIFLPVIIGYTLYQYRVFKGQGAYSSDKA